MTTFTRLSDITEDTTQVSQILFDNVAVAWIEYDTLKRVIVYINNEWYHVTGENLTIRKIVQSICDKRPIVTWTQQGERYDVLDKLVIHAPQNTIRVFNNPKDYTEYSEYDDLEFDNLEFE